MASFSYLVSVLVLCIIIGYGNAQLELNFYAKSCPKAEKIIKDYVQQKVPKAPSTAAAILRMHFHDCFVRVSIITLSTSIYVSHFSCYRPQDSNGHFLFS